jgi:hypothetical protein
MATESHNLTKMQATQLIELLVSAADVEALDKLAPS